MRKAGIILAAFLTVLSAGGCDFLRTLAGKPTSADIEARKQEIALAKEADMLKARQDAILEVEKQIADSLAALDSIRIKKVMMLSPVKLGGLSGEYSLKRYYIVVGSFRSRSNAEKKLSQCTAAGYEGMVIGFRNGMNAVGIRPTDSIAEAFSALSSMKGNGICPKSAWILSNQ